MKTGLTIGGNKILVAYASKYGSTAEVAAAVGEVLRGAGAEVDVLRVQDVKDLSPYSAVVLGTSLRMGSPLGAATRFAKRFYASLAKVPVACFTVGIGMRENTEKNREESKRMLSPVLQLVESPVSLGFFGGKMDYSKLTPLFRFFLSRAKDPANELREGDWRNWEAIRAWAGGLIPLLTNSF